MIDMQRQDSDDTGYLMMIESIITTLTEKTNPPIFYLIYVNNWFGSKWLKFSGKILGELGVWKDKITLPPFSPNRIILEQIYRRKSFSSEYISDIPLKPVHRKISSSMASQRRLSEEYPDATFLWYCSKTISNRRGSVMVYNNISPSSYWCWYADLSMEKHWEPIATKGITQSEYRDFLGMDDTNI